MAGVLRNRYGWRVFPAELAWEGVSQTRPTDGVLPVQADISACPYRDEVFDAVISLDVLVHFPAGDEARAIGELTRILRPGGLMVLRVSALDILHSRHSIFTHERQRFTRRRLAAAVEAHGLEVLRMTYANSLLMPVALVRFRIWEPLMGSEPASGTAPVAKWLDRLLYLPLAIESWWLGLGRNFPAGQSLIVIAAKPRPR
jgi:SAM-dependent methyltransferase